MFQKIVQVQNVENCTRLKCRIPTTVKVKLFKMKKKFLNQYPIKNLKNKKQLMTLRVGPNIGPQERTTDESTQKFELYDAFPFQKLAESARTCCQGVHHIAYTLLLHASRLFVACYQSMLAL